MTCNGIGCAPHRVYSVDLVDQKTPNEVSICGSRLCTLLRLSPRMISFRPEMLDPDSERAGIELENLRIRMMMEVFLSAHRISNRLSRCFDFE